MSASISRIMAELPSSEEPTGMRTAISNSLWSSMGRKSLPICRNMGMVEKVTRIAQTTMTQRCAMDQRSIRRYGPDNARNSTVSLVEPPFCPLPIFRKREQSMGVSVKLTSSETSTAKAAV